MKQSLIPRRPKFRLPWLALTTCALLAVGRPSAEAQLNNGLLAYYPLDGDTMDSAGAFHGEAQPAGTTLAYDTGQIGQGVDLDGVDDYIELTGTEDVFNFQGAPGFTVSLWFRVDNFGKAWQALAAKGEGNRWRIHRQDQSNTITGNGGNADVPANTIDISDGAVHHLALVSTAGENVLLYIDGEMVSEGPAPTLEQNTMPAMLGENPDARGRTWDGLIDDVGVWNRPLSADEVTEIHEAGLAGQGIGDLVPQFLAQISQFSATRESVTGTLSDAPDSQIVRDSWTLTVDGEDVTSATTFTDLGGEVSFEYLVDPPFERGSNHTVIIEAEDTEGNNLMQELSLYFPNKRWVSGGQWTTTHTHASGGTISSTDLAMQLINGELENQGTITVPTDYIHFDDNAAPPIWVDLSRPYPLWDPENGGTGRGDRNQFAIYSRGQAVVTESGTYWFVVNSDDGFSLVIDGTEVDMAGDRGRANSIIEVMLEAGVHDVDFWHWENGGGAGVSVYVSLEPSETQPPLTENWYELFAALNILTPPTDGTLPDTDGDDLPDIWENHFFGDLSRDGSGDFDEDGLSDADELAHQANPALKDTDGDGLEDGPEVHTHGSSPSNPDTDGDTLSDFDEVTVYNTDPANADSDGDGAIDPVEVNPEFDTDPNDPNSVPDVIVASQSGPWMAASTWGGTAPTAGNRYAALAGVSDQLVTSAGTFAGDALILIGAELSLEHTGAASANLTVSNGTIRSGASNTLGGTITFTGDSIVDVGGQTLTIDAQLNGTEGVTFTGGAAAPRGNVEIAGPASTLTGQVNILGTFVSLLSPNGLGGSGEGDILLAGGGLAIGAESKFCGDLLIQGDDFVLALGADITVRDLKGLDSNGDVLFSIHGTVGNASLSATDLEGAGFNTDQVTGDAFLIIDDAVECAPPGCEDPEADSDSDGLTDCDESLVYGTDPNNADTDSDDVDDGTEIADGTNPKAADTDQDGLTDGEEKTLGTDGTLADTDGDGFLDGIEVDRGTDPTNADSFPDTFIVRTIVADGATIDSLALAEDLRDGSIPGTETITFERTINYTDDPATLANIPGDKLFEGGATDNFVVHVTGVFNVPEDGVYSIGFNSDDGAQIKVDGMVVAEFAAPRARNNTVASIMLTAGNHTLDALMYEAGGGAGFEIFWSPGEFSVANGAIPGGMTPMALESAIPSVDEDGDGLNDVWENQHFGDITSQDGSGDPDGDGADNLAEQAAGTDPNNPDTDGDGLNDGDEIAGPTDPLVADTDGDTINDGDEVAAGTDPLSRDTDGDGYSDAGDPEPTNPAVPASAAEFLVVSYDFNEGAGTTVNNAADGGTAEILNGHDAMWNASGSGADDSGYLTFNEDGEGSTAMHIDTGIAASDMNLTEVGSEYTMMAWMNVADNVGDHMIFGQAVDENVLHNGTRDTAYHQGHWGNDIAGGTVEVGTWHHVAYRYQAGEETIFVDGVEVASDLRGPLQSMANIVIGTTRGTTDAARDFTGDLDEVRIYSVGLPLSEILIAAGLTGGDGQPFVFDPSFAIPDGTTYDVEYSLDLQAWQVIANDQTGVYTDDDPGRNAETEGYYRAVYDQ